MLLVARRACRSFCGPPCSHGTGLCSGKSASMRGVTEGGVAFVRYLWWVVLWVVPGLKNIGDGHSRHVRWCKRLLLWQRLRPVAIWDGLSLVNPLSGGLAVVELLRLVALSFHSTRYGRIFPWCPGSWPNRSLR